MTALVWTLIGLAGIIVAIIFSMPDDDTRRLRAEVEELRREAAEIERLAADLREAMRETESQP